MSSIWMKRALLLVVATLGAVAAAEAVLRIRGSHEHEIYDAVFRVPDRCAEEIPYVLKPNLAQARGRGRTLLNTDSLGLRSNTHGATYGRKEPSELRIAVVGDSVTFGEGVRLNEATFSQVLQHELRIRRPDRQTTVFNFGVSAYSVRQMAAVLECRMLEVEPDLVLMTLIESDLNVGRTPRALDSHGHLLDLGGKEPIGPITTVALDVLRSMRLAYAVRSSVLPTWRARSPETQARIAAGELPAYDQIKRFSSFAMSRELPALVVVLPSGRPDALVRSLQRDQIPMVDLSDITRQFTPDQYRTSAFDGHPGPAVHRAIGERLAGEIATRTLNGGS